MVFDIINISIYNVVFGLLQLKLYEPPIKYKERIIRFTEYNYERR
jgi:hypothetical protein